MNTKDFAKLFTYREGQEIHGRKSKNLIILSLMLFGTFLAIAVAVGGLEYLDYKMNDPFVKNLEISIPYEKSYMVEDFKIRLNEEAVKDRFAYDTVLAHVDYPLLFLHHGFNEFRRVKGRSLEHKDPINEQILSAENLIAGRGFSSKKDIGFIVTEKLLREFEYSKNALFMKIGVSKEEEGYFSVPIPIVAVVKELPGLSDFAYTPFFYNAMTSGIDNPFNLYEQTRLVLFTADNVNKNVTSLKKEVQSFFKNHEIYGEMDPAVFTVKSEETYKKGTCIHVTFDPEPESQEVLETMFAELESIIGKSKLHHTYQFSFPMDYYKTIAYDKMSVNLRTLDQVRAFKDYMAKEFDLEVEMSKVKDKENFQAMSILTISISVLLFIFSIVSLVLFLFNLLKSHLEKVKMNIGTFKAFGLSNKNIKSYYKIIVHRFFLKALIIAYIAVFVLSSAFVFFFFPELSYTQMLNTYVVLGIMLIWCVVELVFRSTTTRLLVNTPGDLIYGRDGEQEFGKTA